MRRIKREWGMVLMLFLITVFVAACGGGGGGGESGTQSINYSGSRSQAAITDSSAESVALDAYESGETGGNITGLMDIAPMGGGAAFAPAALPVPLSKAVGRALSSGVPRYTASSSMPGSCGGNAGYSVNINETSGEFSFRFNFKSYCETDGLAETELNGAVGFSGMVNLATGEMDHMTATFSSLTSTRSDGTENITLGGTVGMTMSSPTSGTMTMNFVVRDNLAGKTYWVDNYVANMTDNGTYQEITVSGRFYHHDHGYVDLTTITPLQVYPQDEHPSGGMLQYDGAEGKSVRLTFLSAVSYQVTAELTGDGLFDDFDSGEQPWQ